MREGPLLHTPMSAEMDLCIPNYWDLPREEARPEFTELRKRVLRENEKEIIGRIASRPEPDQEELSAGAYREMIEPQCRDAIFLIRRKGYDTCSSGFGTGGTQVVDGISSLTQRDVDTLTQHGCIIYRPGSLTIRFRPETPDIERITARWNELADLLPDLKTPARPLCSSRDEFYNEVIAQCRGLKIRKTSTGLTIQSDERNSLQKLGWDFLKRITGI